MSTAHTVPPTHKRWLWPAKPNGIDGLQLVEEPSCSCTPVLVRIHAVSLNYRDSSLIAEGRYPGIMEGGLSPGCDCAGEIVAVGSGTGTWALPNFNMAAECLGAVKQGVLFQYRVFPVGGLVRLPEYLSYEEASTFPCVAITAYNVLFGGPQPLQAGQTVVVQGTGGASISAAQLAHASGARIIVTSSSDEKLAAVQKHIGADVEIINYKKHPEWHERVLEITGGRGAEHVVDVAGGDEIPRSVKAVARGGTVSVVGALNSMEIRISVLDMIMKGIIIRGISAGDISHLRASFQLFDAAKIKPIVSKVFEFAQAKEAFKTHAQQDFVGKVVIKVVA
ncbi:NAD(P)-binding protein [Auriculariales sp. MPI-PUGE-AT-0066]|nr:NAD(P)-binding protein [Auriculariales sp. MPI-PUGE-AT-0066]